MLYNVTLNEEHCLVFGILGLQGIFVKYQQVVLSVSKVLFLLEDF